MLGGRGVRDWTHAEDHGSAVWAILMRGVTGENYLAGVGGERENVTGMWEILREMGQAAKEAAEVKYAAQEQ